MRIYRDYNSYLRDIFGERVQKISLDAGLSCPNRDGSISSKGCIFCDGLGSGTGALICRGISLKDQIKQGSHFASERYKAKKFIAYFQSFTNTYAPLSQLKVLYDQALDHPGIVGLSVATRPDCVDDQVMQLLHHYQERYLVWIEFGLQSAHDNTLKQINRGHDVSSFENSVFMAHDYGIPVCAHVILGLPGETRQMMLETARFLGGLPIQGVKIHLLYVVEGTPLASLYKKGEYRCLEREEYVDLVADFLEVLPPGMVIHRLTGDPNRKKLLAPTWAMQKTENLRCIRDRLKERGTWQGKKYREVIAA
ncbi:TIGR01212 family radical SAM protein [Thermodesulfobacteriota bacterium]